MPSASLTRRLECRNHAARAKLAVAVGLAVRLRRDGDQHDYGHDHQHGDGHAGDQPSPAVVAIVEGSVVPMSCLIAFLSEATISIEVTMGPCNPDHRMIAATNRLASPSVERAKVPQMPPCFHEGQMSQRRVLVMFAMQYGPHAQGAA